MLSADDAFNTMLYGVPDNKTINYFQEQINKLNGMGSNFSHWVRESSTNTFNKIYSAPAVAEARKLLYETAVQFREDIFHQVDYENYRPNLLMQQYIMAHPRLSNMYQKEMLSNFNGTYKDPEPEVSPITFKDHYLRVIDGQYIQNPEKQEVLVNCSSSHVDLTNLQFNEQLLVQHAWSVTLKILSDGDDPTDIG